MLNGDVLTDLDLSAQIASHLERGATCTLGLVAVDDPSAFGLVRLNDDGSVRGFVEKPKPRRSTPISSRTAATCSSAPSSTSSGRPERLDRARGVPRLVGEGLYGVATRGAYFMDLGTPERYLDGVRDVLTGRLATATHALLDGDGIQVAADAVVDGRITGPAWIASGARIGEGARIGPNTVIGADVTVGSARPCATRSCSPAPAWGRERSSTSLVGHDGQVGAGAVIGALAVSVPTRSSHRVRSCHTSPRSKPIWRGSYDPGTHR